MQDSQQSTGLSAAATVDILTAAMIDRFGERAAAVAMQQLAAAQNTGDGIADRWLLIIRSIEDRLNAGPSAPSA